MERTSSSTSIATGTTASSVDLVGIQGGWEWTNVYHLALNISDMGTHILGLPNKQTKKNAIQLGGHNFWFSILHVSFLFANPQDVVVIGHNEPGGPPACIPFPPDRCIHLPHIMVGYKIWCTIIHLCITNQNCTNLPPIPIPIPIPLILH